MAVHCVFPSCPLATDSVVQILFDIAAKVKQCSIMHEPKYVVFNEEARVPKVLENH
jgi:hypothetical protein